MFFHCSLCFRWAFLGCVSVAVVQPLSWCRVWLVVQWSALALCRVWKVVQWSPLAGSALGCVPLASRELSREGESLKELVGGKCVFRVHGKTDCFGVEICDSWFCIFVPDLDNK